MSIKSATTFQASSWRPDSTPRPLRDAAEGSRVSDAVKGKKIVVFGCRARTHPDLLASMRRATCRISRGSEEGRERGSGGVRTTTLS